VTKKRAGITSDKDERSVRKEKERQAALLAQWEQSQQGKTGSKDQSQEMVMASQPQPAEAAQESRPAATVQAPAPTNAQEYLQFLAENKKKAKTEIVEIYDLVEKGQNKEALRKFKENGQFIALYVDKQVYNTLEQTVLATIE
jgi:hypothetical protein